MTDREAESSTDRPPINFDEYQFHHDFWSGVASVADAERQEAFIGKNLTVGDDFEFGGTIYSFPTCLIREALLGDPLKFEPLLSKSMVTDVSIKLHFNLELENAYKATTLKYLLLRDLPALPYLLQNGRQSAASECFLGQDVIPEQSCFHESIACSINNLALGKALVNGLTIKGREISMSSEPASADEKIPEASWIFRLSYNEDYFARIGMNFHVEGEDVVCSITNIQGIDKQTIRRLKRKDEWWPVTAISDIARDLPNEITVIRGIPAARHPSCLEKDSILNGLLDATILHLGTVDSIQLNILISSIMS